jgi:hypothetical protein
MRITYAYNHSFTFIASTITTTLSNGQTTVVGSIIYQYGNNDNVGGGQSNDNGNGNSAPSSPAPSSPAPSSPTPSSPVSKSSAVRQVADFLRLAEGWGWGWGFFAWVTTVMVMAA